MSLLCLLSIPTIYASSSPRVTLLKGQLHPASLRVCATPTWQPSGPILSDFTTAAQPAAHSASSTWPPCCPSDLAAGLPPWLYLSTLSPGVTMACPHTCLWTFARVTSQWGLVWPINIDPAPPSTSFIFLHSPLNVCVHLPFYSIYHIQTHAPERVTSTAIYLFCSLLSSQNLEWCLDVVGVQ